MRSALIGTTTLDNRLRSRRQRAVTAVRRCLLTIGAATTALIALAAAGQLGWGLSNVWRAFGQEMGFRGLGVLAALVTASLWILWAVARARPAWLAHWMPWTGLALVVVIRAAAILLFPTAIPAGSDQRALHELAVHALETGDWLVAHRPMGYSAMLGGLYAAFGVNPGLGEMLNLGWAMLGGWFLYLLVHGLWGARAGAVAITLYAIAPSQVLLTTAIFNETAYAALVVAALVGMVAMVRSQAWQMAIVAGAMLAASQYIRPISQAFVVALALGPLLAGLRTGRAVLLGVVATCTFVIVLTPVAIHNLTAHGDLSLSTSSYGGWSLFVGANQTTNGRWNRADAEILASMPGDTLWARSRSIEPLAWKRITGDPRGFLSLAVRKFHVMWADDAWSVGAFFAEQRPPRDVRTALALHTQAFYAALVAAAAVALWRQRRGESELPILIALVLLVVVVAHTFVEVHPRYHAYIIPLLSALAAPLLADRLGGGDAAAPTASPSPTG